MSIPDDGSVVEPDEPLPVEAFRLVPDERDPEASPEDVAEQVEPVDPAQPQEHPVIGGDVSEWDAIEQSRIVELDDDYREA